MSAYRKFKSYGFRKKINTVKRHGALIARRYAYGCEIHLFAIKNYFVEVWTVQSLPWRYIFRIRSFRNPRNLDPYLEQVDVKSIHSA